MRSEEEFVFGSFASSYVSEVVQTPIAAIEAKSLISFGKLAAVDPLGRNDEARFNLVARLINDLTDIQFVS
ncbi:hypothetical protein ACFFJ7_17365 [Pseudochelatococcus lubricantis]|uniref:hypothetical protein n=1 Tax=Pseudochelatococcus lubricantis TaxID=1538102 RepID=UPI0035EA4713